MFDLINLGVGSGGARNSIGTHHIPANVTRTSPTVSPKTPESKAVNQLIAALDSRSFDPNIFAYLLEMRGGDEGVVTFMRVIDAFLDQMLIRYYADGSRSIGEQEAGIVAARIKDALAVYRA